ncbi:hypothetical protein F5H01DRAFT_8950 [Linnemannia elongata]|nr:hypothetical protein F5H01DRAFT_8950 [Linnemannia elongata]
MSWNSPANNQPSAQQWGSNTPWGAIQQDSKPGSGSGGGGWDSTSTNQSTSNQTSNNWGSSPGNNDNNPPASGVSGGWASSGSNKSSYGAAPASNGGGGGGWNSSAAASGGGGWGADTSSSQADKWNALSKHMESTSLHDDQADRHDRPSFQQEPHEGKTTIVPQPTMTIEEAWPSFAEADESRDLDDIKTALAQLCGAFQGRSWQELEKKLREENCNTYLVAVVRANSHRDQPM